MQLHHFNLVVDELQRHGVALHAITAEPGGEATLRQRLSRYGLPELRFPVISDPSWSLMTLEPREIYVECPSHPFLLKAGAFDEPYRMCQPALAVVDSGGSVEYWWSWSKLREGVVNEDGILPNGRRADNPDGNTHDVRWRLVPADLLRRLAGGGDLQALQVDNLGFPDGADHVNVKKQLGRDPAEHRRQQQARGEATDIVASRRTTPAAKL